MTMETKQNNTPKEYFLDALKSLLRVFTNLGKGIYFAVKNNIAWAILLALFLAYHVLTLMQARDERDAYNHRCVVLEQKLDSLQQNVTYEAY